VTTRSRYSGRTPASPGRRTRTIIRASSLDTTSARPPKKVPCTDERLASVPPLSYGLWNKLCMGLSRDRGAERSALRFRGTHVSPKTRKRGGQAGPSGVLVCLARPSEPWTRR